MDNRTRRKPKQKPQSNTPQHRHYAISQAVAQRWSNPSSKDTISRPYGKISNKYRNLPCPCGSGLKFKKCCGSVAQEEK